MRTTLFILLFCSWITSEAIAQKLQVAVKYVTSNGTNDNSIIYYSSKKLTWNDFKGAPVAADDASAITSAGFGFGAGFKQSGNQATLNLIPKMF